MSQSDLEHTAALQPQAHAALEDAGATPACKFRPATHDRCLQLTRHQSGLLDAESADRKPHFSALHSVDFRWSQRTFYSQ